MRLLLLSSRSLCIPCLDLSWCTNTRHVIIQRRQRRGNLQTISNRVWPQGPVYFTWWGIGELAWTWFYCRKQWIWFVVHLYFQTSDLSYDVVGHPKSDFKFAVVFPFHSGINGLEPQVFPSQNISHYIWTFYPMTLPILICLISHPCISHPWWSHLRCWQMKTGHYNPRVLPGSLCHGLLPPQWLLRA